MCFDCVGDVQAAKSKSEQRRVDRNQKEAILGRARCHVAAWRIHVAA